MIEFSKVTSVNIPQGSVAKIEEITGRVLWQGYDEFDGYIDLSSSNPFSCTFLLNTGSTTGMPNLKYTTDRKKWENVVENVAMESSADESGIHHIVLRGDGNECINGNFHLTSATDTPVDCNGNLLSLLSYTKLKRHETIALGERCFHHLFDKNPLLVSAPEITFKEVPDYGLANSFAETSIVEAPSLMTVEKIGREGTAGMFFLCRKLVRCARMSKCWNFGVSACEGMYQGCEKMNTIPLLFAGASVSHIYVSDYAFWDFVSERPTTEGGYIVPIIGLNSDMTSKHKNEYTIGESLDVSAGKDVFKYFATTMSGGNVDTPVLYKTYYTNAEIIG